ncbi:MAG: hypothetical protein HYV39_02140 [Candidatus Levybacteria bacterium]|nr:hypothetical protein [Candidatus Levybacteria bacterium]
MNNFKKINLFLKYKQHIPMFINWFSTFFYLLLLAFFHFSYYTTKTTKE